MPHLLERKVRGASKSSLQPFVSLRNSGLVSAPPFSATSVERIGWWHIKKGSDGTKGTNAQKENAGSDEHKDAKGTNTTTGSKETDPQKINAGSTETGDAKETKTAAELLQLADTLACKILHDRCMSYIIKNISEVRTIEGYASLAHKCPKLMMGIVAAMCAPSKKRQRPE